VPGPGGEGRRVESARGGGGRQRRRVGDVALLLPQRAADRAEERERLRGADLGRGEDPERRGIPVKTAEVDGLSTKQSSFTKFSGEPL